VVVAHRWTKILSEIDTTPLPQW